MIDPDTDRERVAPTALPDWDYQTDVRLRRRIAVDSGDARMSAGLPQEARLAVSVRWDAAPSLIRGSAAWIPLEDDQHEYTVQITLPGARIGGMVQVETMLVLASEIPHRPATAHLPGSLLWNDSIEIRLQGDAPLFPIALVPFSGSSLPDRAAWFLELGSDLEASALGAVQLLVNQEHPPVVAALTHAAAPDAVERTVLSALRSDVVRSMLERAITDEEFEMVYDYGKQTLGSVLQGLIRTCLSNYVQEDMAEIRRLHANDPPTFAAVVQAATALFQPDGTANG
ncbi:hypothetical protein [Actinoplanes sp. NPDC049681]|uniref:hypothetical protein n=1 Tax=Actinoplanes sp. NPDC049681 TaxID=3363905 RepID=UPI0037B872FE